MDEPRPWHRLFGMSWQDFFAGLPVTVEAEKDLSEKQQRLDVVVVRQASFDFPHRPPDGFEEIGPHNLFSFKSFQEAMDGEVVEELIGHGVNYRKQASSSMNDLLPPDDVRLFAICVRSRRS